MDEVSALWSKCCGALETQVSEATWQTLFAGLEPVAIEGDTLVLSAPNALVRERVDDR